MKIQRERGGLKCGRLFRQAPIFRNRSRKYTFRLSANTATHETGFTSRLKIDLDRINERHEPLQQLLMNRMRSISV
jgi:hypothetical protein